MLYVNADDFGWTSEITDRSLNCYRNGRINSASAMTFMKDSVRAFDLAREYSLPLGLHLNFTQDFSGGTVTANLKYHHKRLATYLNTRKVNQILYNPMLRGSFGYVFQAQWEEFCRLYGEAPKRLDGHDHMHLCMNMIVSDIYPRGLEIRRNFTFGPGEKDIFNRIYRHLIDSWLISRYRCKDNFFSIAPIELNRLQRIVSISKMAQVELMVHPGVEGEFRYLLSGNWYSMIFE